MAGLIYKNGEVETQDFLSPKIITKQDSICLGEPPGCQPQMEMVF
jgi:hypothetical protein